MRPAAQWGLSFGALAALILVTVPARTASIPVAHADGNDCVISSDLFAKLAAIQNNASLSYDEELKEELVARKEILAGIIACGTEEASTLKNSVNALSFSDPNLTDLKNQFADQLGQAEAYYEAQAAKIDGLGIYGTKELARSIADWRAGTYLPLSQRAGNLIIWERNQPLMATSENRLQSISSTVTSLKLTDNGDVANALGDAQKNLAATEDLNTQAEESILHGGTSDATLALIKTSLDSLAATYQSFFSVSDAANKILLH